MLSRSANRVSKTGKRFFALLDDAERTFLPPSIFVDQLRRRNMDFFTGVPDSILKEFCSYVEDHVQKDNHVMTGNEGQSIAVAAGYNMATGKIPVVYLQNSGLGNIINPVLSLTHKGVYSVPMVILAGWRGEPGRKDEPQHRIMGKITQSIAHVCDLPFDILPDFEEGADEVLDQAVEHCQTNQTPFLLLVRKRTFESYKAINKVTSDMPLLRERVLEIVGQNAPKKAVFVGTTGFTSRELFEIREKNGQTHATDFYTVGCMGHASSIGIGLAAAQPHRPCYVCDGDGATLMHMSGMATVGSRGFPNYNHILINNHAHESTGAQPTGSANIDFNGIAKACGYRNVQTATTEEELYSALQTMDPLNGPNFLEVKTRPGARKELGRPTSTPLQNKKELMAFLRKSA